MGSCSRSRVRPDAHARSSAALLIAKLSCVLQILRSPTRFFEDDEIFSADHPHAHVAVDHRCASSEARSEVAARNALHEIDACRRMPHPNNVELRCNGQRLEDSTGCTKPLQRRNSARHILRRWTDPEVGVFREPRTAMHGDGMTADQQVLNAARFELRKQSIKSEGRAIGVPQSIPFLNKL